MMTELMYCNKLKSNTLIRRVPISWYIQHFLPSLRYQAKNGWSCQSARMHRQNNETNRFTAVSWWLDFKTTEWYFYFLFFAVFSSVVEGDWLSRGNGWSGINGELRRFGSPGFGNCWPNDGPNPKGYCPCGWIPKNGRKFWPDIGFWNGKGIVWVFVVTVDGGLALQPVGFPLPITQQATRLPALPDTKLSALFAIPKSSGNAWSW